MSARNSAKRDSQQETIATLANGRLQISHKSEHTRLTKQVAELKSPPDAGQNIRVLAASNLRCDWLHNHVLVVDEKLAAALKEQRQTAWQDSR